MGAFEKIKETWKKHPYLFAGGIFVVGILVIYLLFKKSPTVAASSDSTDAQAYYAAAAAATQSGNQLQAAQVAASAATTASNNQLTATLADIQAQQQTNQTNATAATTASNNQLAATLAAIQAQQQTDQTNATEATKQVALNTQQNEYTSLLATQGNITTAALNTQQNEYTSLLSSFIQGAQLQSQNIQNAINGVVSLNNNFVNAGGLNYGGVAPGSETITNFAVNQNAGIGGATDNPSALLATRYIPGIDPNNLEHLSGVPFSQATLASLGFSSVTTP